MVTEEQRYTSGIFRNIGFTFLAPFGSMVFQYLLFDKIFTVDKVTLCIIISLLSYFLFLLGYNEIKEREDVKS